MASSSSTEEHPNAKYNKKDQHHLDLRQKHCLPGNPPPLPPLRHPHAGRLQIRLGPTRQLCPQELFKTLQYMDPSLIESHIGVQGTSDGGRSEGERYSEVLKASVEVQGIKKEMEEIRKMNEEENEEAKA
ncbi:hypothetical protein ACHAWO_007365 [Cyclotella atomus]|uniref:Uncharacterized protein n=1 Tax=Cyclotella atomus TaxID=382360 RepID=A0ABD3NLV3_9STRA